MALLGALARATGRTGIIAVPTSSWPRRATKLRRDSARADCRVDLVMRLSKSVSKVDIFILVYLGSFLGRS